MFHNPDAARDIFAASVAANPLGHRVLQAWGVMEMRESKPRGSLEGLTVARPLFARAAELAPWDTKVWSAWALAEFAAYTDPDRVRQLYSKGLDAEPTNTTCLVGLGKVERLTGRLTQSRDYLERARDLEPLNRFCVKELAMLEQTCGNRGLAARHFNAARRMKQDEARVSSGGGAGVGAGAESRGFYGKRRVEGVSVDARRGRARGEGTQVGAVIDGRQVTALRPKP